MSFHDQVIADMAAIFDDCGVDSTYTPVGGYGFSCSIIKKKSDMAASFAQDISDTQDIEIQHSTFVAEGLDGPTKRHGNQPGDTITMPTINGDDEDWMIVGAEPDTDTGTWTLTLARNERAKA